MYDFVLYMARAGMILKNLINNYNSLFRISKKTEHLCSLCFFFYSVNFLFPIECLKNCKVSMFWTKLCAL